MTSPFFPLTALALLLSACSSSDDTPKEPGDRDGQAASCTCDVTVHGEQASIACGKSACLAGQSYPCDTHEGAVRGGAACDASTDPNESSSGAPSSSGAAHALAEAGEVCDRHDDCVSGLCVTSLDIPVCTKLCRGDSECPAGLPSCNFSLGDPGVCALP